MILISVFNNKKNYLIILFKNINYIKKFINKSFYLFLNKKIITQI